MDFTDREIVLMRMAVSYALSNSDDLNDAFACAHEENPDDKNLVKVGLEVVDATTGEEIKKLLERFSPEAIEAEFLKLSTMADAESNLHREQQRHQETKWKYADTVQRERRWRDAYLALIRAAFPEQHESKED